MKTDNKHSDTTNTKKSRIDDSIQKSQRFVKAKHRKIKNESSAQISQLWFWLGIITLILILLYWIFFIAIDFGVNQ